MSAPAGPPESVAARALRVLVVGAGVTPWLDAMLTGTTRLRAQVAVLDDRFLPETLEGREVAVLSGGSGPLASVGSVVALARAIRTGRPDVVVGNGSRAQALVLLASLVAGARTVWIRESRRHRFTDTVLAGLSHGVIDAPDGFPRPEGQDTTRPEAFVAALTRAAMLPGAGLDTERPVSIVLPVYNEGPVVQPVLSLLIAQLRGEDEIVVVDDGSTDDTLQQTHEVARLTPDRVRVLHQPRNQGAGAARNRGVREARHEILAFTDAGCTPAPGWLEAVRRGFAETPQPDLVAGVYEVTTGSLFEQAVAAGCYPSVREARHPDLHHRLYGRLLGRVFDGTRPAGRSMAVLRSAFDRVGGFRDGRAAAEDIDFARAVVVSGGRWVLSTEANVIWQQRPGWRSTARMYYRYGQGDGLSADAQAVIRNLLRAGAYVVGPAVVQRGSRPIRFVAAAAGLFYLSLPLRRAASGPAAPAVMFMAPAVLILKDLAKAVGCLTGLLRRRYGGYRTTRPSIPSGQEATR